MQLPVEHKVILFSDLRIRADSLQYIIKEWKCYIYSYVYILALRDLDFKFFYIKYNLIVHFEHIHDSWIFI